MGGAWRVRLRGPPEGERVLDLPKNRLLSLLAEPDWAVLLPALRRTRLAQGAVLQEARLPVTAIHFPISCVVSLMQSMRDGVSVEGACIGGEGAVGLSGMVPCGLAEGRGLVHVPGEAWVIEAPELQRVVRERPSIREILQRFQALLMLQLMQTVGCNQVHSAEQRMARWLLTMFERASTDELAVTHEFLGEVLAIRRPTVTSLANGFRQRGALTFARGRVRLCDAPLLETMSCECHARLRVDVARMYGGAA
jgi:membrane protein implicated in regulation of membrane protease activity